MDAAGETRAFAARAPQLAALPVLAVAVLPKCPLCLMILFGALGIPHGGHDAAFDLLRGAIVLAAVGALALRRPGRVSLLLAIGGASVIAVGGWTSTPALQYAGALLIAAAWLWTFRRTDRGPACGCAESR